MSFQLALMVSLYGSLLATPVPQLPRTPRDFRTNTTAHLIFSSASGLLQHWPNTVYRNGHTFVPATVPVGTLLYHSRPSFEPPPSPEFFAFDFDHSYIFCSQVPCVMYTYIPRRDLKLGYFDGTSAATLEGPRDLQDIAFNDRFVSGKTYNPWVHAVSMCKWAEQVGLDGIVRMEPSFEAVLCHIESDLQLTSRRDLLYHETNLFPGQGVPGGPSATSMMDLHPRLGLNTPHFPGPMIPAYPSPPGWKGRQRNFADVAFESIRAGMWHNHFPGESRVILDYSSIVSAYDETYSSLVHDRQGVPRMKHRLNNISAGDMSRLKTEMEEVLKTGRPAPSVNWRSLLQDIVSRYGERLEELRYLLRRSDLDAEAIVAKAREKILIMLTPHIVLPKSQSNSIRVRRGDQQPLHTSSSNTSASQSIPDDGWPTRIYDACANHPTIDFARERQLTAQEERLANSIERVNRAICSTLITVWATAFDSGDKPLLAKHMVIEWKKEIEELMDWLDWTMWIKCDPPCGQGFQCTLATWPWEVFTGEEDIGPVCRDHAEGDIY
ncbi:unnamed protein product [Rhizoctonia solani]|uniref:Uncharacterized protein n=1 Tax=Rhizoctonia solani TaxID=456999 RepID=A0A8H3CAJ2_9AGAM|nr:unnamed protein product [Rhizoctonia solani]